MLDQEERVLKNSKSKCTQNVYSMGKFILNATRACANYFGPDHILLQRRLMYSLRYLSRITGKQLKSSFLGICESCTINALSIMEQY